MDLEKLKKKAIELKEKALKKTEDAITYSANKLTESSLTINTKEELDSIIKKSATTSFTSKETGITKEYKHKSIVIFAEEGSDFFKEALYALPVIVTKAFSQSISVKLAKSKINNVELSDYQINTKTFPCMIIFEEEKVLKTIEGTENILKLVKSFDLNINKLIDGI